MNNNPTDRPAVSRGARQRNSQDTRDRLLVAARELFTERGYDQTTVREIGHRSDVDPALIARYFGSKAALYLASMRPGDQSATVEPLDLRQPDVVQLLLDRVGSAGPSPTLNAAIRPHGDAELQSAAMEFLRQRMLEPTQSRALAAGHDDPQLRAEIAVAALAGITISRASKAFPALSVASSADVGRLVARLINDLIEPGSA